ncbi:hypothetical protein BLOT_009898, partial [Blomia tropicalis]
RISISDHSSSIEIVNCTSLIVVEQFDLKMFGKYFLRILTLLLLYLETISTNLVYQCFSFDSLQTDTCGHNLNRTTKQWTIRETKSLPNIWINTEDTQCVLTMNETLLTSTSSFATYELNWPINSMIQSVNDLCLQYGIIVSNDCVDDLSDDRLCHTNVTIFNPITLQTIKSIKSFTFLDQGWSIINNQFDLSNVLYEQRIKLQIRINGFIMGNVRPSTDTMASNVPYQAIKFINIYNQTCSNRIGPRKNFWITILVLFSILTGFTFVYIAYEMVRTEHQKRTSGF